MLFAGAVLAPGRRTVAGGRLLLLLMNIFVPTGSTTPSSGACRPKINARAAAAIRRAP